MYVGVYMRLGRATHLEAHFILINTIWNCRISLVCKKKPFVLFSGMLSNKEYYGKFLISPRSQKMEVM